MFHFDGYFPKRIAPNGCASDAEVFANDFDAGDFFDGPESGVDGPVPLFDTFGEQFVAMLQMSVRRDGTLPVPLATEKESRDQTR